jgi:hypothetical protein
VSREEVLAMMSGTEELDALEAELREFAAQRRGGRRSARRGGAMMPRRDVPIGLIGSGFMGKGHAVAYRLVGSVFDDLAATPRLRLLADVDAELAARAARDLGFEAATGDWRELVAHPEVESSTSPLRTTCTPRWRSPRSRRASTSTARSPSRSTRRRPTPWPTPPSWPGW